MAAAQYQCGHCGCDEQGRAPDGGRWTVEGVARSSFCFRRYITPRSYFFLELHAHYKNGILPVAGGLLEQPAVYYSAMTAIDTERRKHGQSSS